MSDEQGFSIEQYVAAWRESIDNVTVEGVVHDDGAYVVIDTDPKQLGKLYRVRKSDITSQREVGTRSWKGQDHRVLRVSIKKNVPIICMTIVRSDVLSGRTRKGQATASITVTFQNYSVYQKRWIIKDGVSNQRVFDGLLEPRNDAGDSVELLLSTRASGYGEAYYRHRRPIYVVTRRFSAGWRQRRNDIIYLQSR